MSYAKFRNKPVEDPEFGRFDSKREYRRWLVLRLMLRAGEISKLERQVAFPLKITDCDGNPALLCTYRADFCYTERGQYIVEDAKGVKTPEYKLKRKLMKLVNGIDIRET